jgi:hypothetical protein
MSFEKMSDFTAWIYPSLTTGYFILLLLSALIIGMSKAGLSGFGLAMVPLMAMIFGAKESTGVILPMLIAADIMSVVYYHQHAVWKHIVRVIPWAAAGIVTALIVGNSINSSQFRLLLLTIVWIMLLLMLVNDIRSKRGAEITENHFFASLMGTTGGFSTMIGNAAGPVFTLYFLAMKLPKKEFIGTSAWLFFILNTGKLPLQALVWKNINQYSLMAGLVSLPFIALGMFLGIHIVKLLPESFYRIFVIITTLLTSLLLLI